MSTLVKKLAGQQASEPLACLARSRKRKRRPSGRATQSVHLAGTFIALARRRRGLLPAISIAAERAEQAAQVAGATPPAATKTPEVQPLARPLQLAAARECRWRARLRRHTHKPRPQIGGRNLGLARRFDWRQTSGRQTRAEVETTERAHNLPRTSASLRLGPTCLRCRSPLVIDSASSLCCARNQSWSELAARIIPSAG